MKILIIEDDKNIAMVLEQFLKPISSQITIAQNMEQALKAVAEAEDIELITLDLGLPDSDVTSTVKRQIRKLREIKPNSLIIVVTGYDLPNLESMAMEEGADGFIVKQDESFTAKGFLEVVAKIVEKYMKSSTHPTRSIELLEKVSTRIAKYQNEVSSSSATA